MKKIIAMLLLVCGAAHAETWFEMPNKSGGKILLLMTKCSDVKDGRVVIATSPDGTNSTGCWWYFADMVHVAWSEGSIKTSSFDPAGFTLKESK